MSPNLPAQTSTDRPQIRHENHYVPKGLLRNWSLDGSRIQEYQLLVSHPRVDIWKPEALRNAAKRRDLYTVRDGEHDSDDFERWIEQFEDKAIPATRKLVNGKRMTADDWEWLTKLYLLQLSRTPLGYLEFMAKMEVTLPKLLDELVAPFASADELHRSLRTKQQRRRQARGSNHYRDAFKVSVVPDDGQLKIEANVISGRRLWLASQKQIITGRVPDALSRHRWRLFRAYGREEWPLTDNPAARVGYRSDSEYWFTAGVGQPKANLMMPLTPKLLMFAEVGDGHSGTMDLDLPMTQSIQRVLLNRAHRFIYSTHRDPRIAAFRPRRVDAATFAFERRQWANWHSNQSAAEGDWATRAFTDAHSAFGLASNPSISGPSLS